MRGEISGFKGAAGSGHCYFTLKDAGACLDAVVWRLTFQRLRFKPQEGLEMVATGKLTTYPSRSRYQLVVENLEPAGEGALMALLEERRRKLAGGRASSIAARKKPIPYLPRVIGVVTSPTRRGDPRHPAPPARPLPEPRARLAGAGAGRGRGGGGRGGAFAASTPSRPAAPSRGPIC